MTYPPITQERIDLFAEIFATAVLFNKDESGDFAPEVIRLAEAMNLVEEMNAMIRALLTTNSSDRAYSEEEVDEFIREVVTPCLISKQR